MRINTHRKHLQYGEISSCKWKGIYNVPEENAGLQKPYVYNALSNICKQYKIGADALGYKRPTFQKISGEIIPSKFVMTKRTTHRRRLTADDSKHLVLRSNQTDLSYVIKTCNLNNRKFFCEPLHSPHGHTPERSFSLKCT